MSARGSPASGEEGSRPRWGAPAPAPVSVSEPSVLVVLLGGRAAEWVVYKHWSTGASDDLARAREMLLAGERPFVLAGGSQWTPEGARALGLNGAEIVFNPSATVAGLSQYLWKIEQPAHAVANGYYVGAINRVGTEPPWNIGKFYGNSYFVNPRGELLVTADQHGRTLPRPRTRAARGPARAAAPDTAWPTGAREALLPRPPSRSLRSDAPP